MKKMHVLMAALFLVLSAFPVLAQDAGSDNGEDAVVGFADAGTENAQDSQGMVNDEGYGVNDAEYYAPEEGAENVDATDMAPADDSVFNDDSMMDAGMDNEMISEEDNGTMADENETVPEDTEVAPEEGMSNDEMMLLDDSEAVLEEADSTMPSDNGEEY